MWNLVWVVAAVVLLGAAVAVVRRHRLRRRVDVLVRRWSNARRWARVRKALPPAPRVVVSRPAVIPPEDATQPLGENLTVAAEPQPAVIGEELSQPEVDALGSWIRATATPVPPAIAHDLGWHTGPIPVIPTQRQPSEDEQ